MRLRLPSRRGAAWAFTGAALVLSLAWFASRWHSVTLRVRRESVGVSRGCVFMNHYSGVLDGPAVELSGGLNEPFSWDWWGGAAASPRYRAAGFPLWWAALPGAVVAGFSWRPALEAARRRRTGRCAACGYDLRGLNPCPECGAAAQA